MGILYSITSMFYPSANTKISQARIISKSKRLIHFINLRKAKLQQQTKKIEQELIKMIMQLPESRSRAGQRTLIDMVVMNSEKLLAYDEVIYCLNKIIGEAHTLEVAPQSISNDCVVAISSVIFVDGEMGLNNDVSLDQFIPKPRPTIGIEKISQKLQKYLKKGKVTQFEANTYALQLGKRNNISLEKINEGGHNFTYDPSEVNPDSASGYMFAVSIQTGEYIQQ